MHKLKAVAYLWGNFYGCLLAKGKSVSVSPGYELIGWRVNRKKRKRGGE